MARLEAVLVIAREPLTSRKLSQYANLADATEARTLIRLLNERYDQRGRAFRIVEVAGGYQLLTRPQFAAWLRRLGHAPHEVRLSAPSLETLAVIAYRQPVGRADIEAVRGVHSGEIIRQLMDRDLVRIAGRGEELGRPYLYSTTKRFLQIFGLSSLSDLPRAEIVRQAAADVLAADRESRVILTANNDLCSEEEKNVSVTTLSGLTVEEELRPGEAAILPSAVAMAKDEDMEEDFDDEDDDDEDDLDDDEDDLDEEDEEDDLEEEEWEEVDDEDDFDEEDEEDEDWDDDDDDDLDDDEDEDEEEEDWEEGE